MLTMMINIKKIELGNLINGERHTSMMNKYDLTFSLILLGILGMSGIPFKRQKEKHRIGRSCRSS
jgi:hypothetical protein